MAGFLDNLDPTSAFLLAAGSGLMGTRGPGGFGRAGLMGLDAMQAAKRMRLLEEESRQRAAEQASVGRMRDLQMQQVQQAMAEAQRKQQQATQIQQAARDSIMGPAQVALAGGGGPTVANAATMDTLPQGARTFDEQGFADRVFQIDPMSGLELRQQIKERNKPKLTTVPEGSSIVSTDPTTGKTTRVFGGGINPNKPFSIGDDGQVVPNPAFQAYELSKANAGAARVSVSNPFETEYSKASGKGFADMKGEINTAGFKAPSTIRSLERMEQLLAGVDGGVLAPTGLEIASAARSFGINLDSKLGNKEAAEALTREIAQSYRQPGSGPQTDKDFENFMKMSPGLAKTAEGRKQIIQTLKNKAARDIKIAQMARDYERKHGRIDDGFLDDVATFVSMQPVVPLPAGWQATPIGK